MGYKTVVKQFKSPERPEKISQNEFIELRDVMGPDETGEPVE